MYSETFEKLLQYGLDQTEIDLIKAKKIDWDIVDEKLSIWDEDGSCRHVCWLSEKQTEELLNLYRFESRELVRRQSTGIFQPGDVDDWAGVSPKTDWKKYVDGYVKSAETLGDSAPNHLIEPYLFLCRHSLELMLKTIVMLGQNLYELSPDLPGHHDLQRLWTAAYPIIKLMGKCDDNELDVLNKFIDQYHAIDKSSYSFRYPVSKNNDEVKYNNYLTAFRLSSHRESFKQVIEIFFKILKGLEIRRMLKNFNKWRADKRLQDT